jgi:hypothetical protein
MMKLPDELPKFFLAAGDSTFPEDFVLSLQFKQEEWDRLRVERKKEIRMEFTKLWRLIYGCTYEYDPKQEDFDQLAGTGKWREQ